MTDGSEHEKEELSAPSADRMSAPPSVSLLINQYKAVIALKETLIRTLQEKNVELVAHVERAQVAYKGLRESQATAISGDQRIFGFSQVIPKDEIMKATRDLCDESRAGSSELGSIFKGRVLTMAARITKLEEKGRRLLGEHQVEFEALFRFVACFFLHFFLFVSFFFL